MILSDRERLAFEQVRRWPVSYCLQFFCGFLGALTLLTYFADMVTPEPDMRSVGREAVTAGIVSVLFTLIMRRRSGRASPGAPAA